MTALITVCLLLLLYLLPSLIAERRGHHNLGAIFILNLFFGWTVFGWFGSLIWAATAVKE